MALITKHTPTLCDLAPETLSIITSFDGNNNAIYNLWNCGNTRLNTKLANGGIASLVLQNDLVSKTTLVIPYMTNYLHRLTTLKVCAEHAFVSEFILKDLPSTLTHLMLVFTGVANVITTLPTHLENLNYLEVREPQASFTLSSRILDNLPPTLETLKLSSIDAVKVNDDQIDEELRATSLITYVAVAGAMEDGIRKLPNNLRVLHLDVTDYVDFIRNLAKHPFLRQSLVEICYLTGPHYQGVVHTTACDVVNLPESLTSLNIRLPSQWKDPLPVTPLAFPPNLVTLTVQFKLPSEAYFRAVWAAIPKTVTDLSFMVQFQTTTEHYIFTHDEFKACLPPNLHSLNIRYLPIHWAEDGLGANFWPSSLRHISFIIESQDDDKLSSYNLPTQMNSICVNSLYDVEWHTAVAGMHFIHTLDIQTRDLNFRRLPCLTELNVTVFMGNNFSFLEDLTLPPTLLRLTINVPVYTSNDMAASLNFLRTALPPKLQVLNMAKLGAMLSSVAEGFFVNLPKSITSISVCLLGKIEPADQPSPFECLKHLPDTIKSLSVSCATLTHTLSSTTISGMLRMSYLPVNLESLEVRDYKFLGTCFDVAMPCLKSLAIRIAKDVDYKFFKSTSLYPRLVNAKVTY